MSGSRPIVFISYRRDDAEGSAGRLHDALAGRFGNRIQIFRDVETIEPGQNFKSTITQKTQDCDALIAVIGTRWLSPRLALADDILKQEIAAALLRNVTVIPVLVHGAAMPPPDSLPPELQELALRHAVPLSDPAWASGVARLADLLEKILLARPERTEPEAPPLVITPLELFWSGERIERQSAPARRLESSFRYDAYIAHAAADRHWALKLEAALKAVGVAAIAPIGEPDYSPAIEDAVRSSKHLVTLWTDAAKTSDHVVRAIGLFDGLRHREASRGRLIPVVLEGSPPSAYADVCMVMTPSGAVYASGPDGVDAATWQEIVDRVAEALADDTRPVSVVVLASTKDRMKALKPGSTPFLGLDLDRVLRSLGIDGLADLVESYGATPMEWRPHGVGHPIIEQLRLVMNTANQGSGDGMRVRWNHLREPFWSEDFNTAMRTAAELTKGRCLIVIDSLSLFDPAVFRRLDLLDRAFENNRAVVLAFLPDVYPMLRKRIMKGLHGRLPILNPRDVTDELAGLVAQPDERDRGLAFLHGR